MADTAGTACGQAHSGHRRSQPFNCPGMPAHPGVQTRRQRGREVKHLARAHTANKRLDPSALRKNGGRENQVEPRHTGCKCQVGDGVRLIRL